MKVLILNDARRCPHGSGVHCYGVDNLIQGFYALLGADNVFEFPEKPNLHLRPDEQRDACQIDSDAWLPSKGTGIADARELARAVDCVILTGIWGAQQVIRDVAPCIPPHTPVVGLHYDDELRGTQAELEECLGRPLTRYFHRENPPDGALPLFLSVPSSRFRPVEHKPRQPRVFYWGTDHGWPKDNPRRRMLDSIIAAVPAEQRFLRLTPTQDNGRLPVEVYRERLWESDISVVWNSNDAAGFSVWDSNRLWESLALGCRVVAERPKYAWPQPDLSYGGVQWVGDPGEVGEAVKVLLDTPPSARRGADGQGMCYTNHSSESRARAILLEVGLY